MIQLYVFLKTTRLIWGHSQRPKVLFDAHHHGSLTYMAVSKDLGLIPLYLILLKLCGLVTV